MSSSAVTRRLRQVDELRRVCLILADSTAAKEIRRRHRPTAWHSEPCLHAVDDVALFEQEISLMKFEWDPAKNEKNLKKHRVAFTEAATVFADPFSDTFPDTDHSIGEFRYVTVGQSTSGRLLVIGHTDRYDAIRIITARHATPHEKRYYENKRR